MTDFNYRIERTSLGFDVHGIPTMHLMLQSRRDEVVPFVVDMRNQTFATALSLLSALGLSRWEELKGKYCRLRVQNDETLIGHIVEDTWFNPNG